MSYIQIFPYTRKKVFVCLSLIFHSLVEPLHLVFISPHLQETAFEILITMHYQDYVLSILRSPMCVFLRACVLSANDGCF